MRGSPHIRIGVPVIIALAAVLLQTPAAPSARAEIPNDDRAIVHALNRLAFGARPGDVAQVRRVGLARWIDQQLRPERVPDGALDERLARLTTLSLEPEALGETFIAARQERRLRQQAASQTPPDGNRETTSDPNSAAMDPMMDPAMPRAARRGQMSENVQRGRQVFAELAEAKLLRAVYSERQLEEVLTDFWFNHFNVFARKGQTEIYVGEYEREAIRPHVLGRFRELLGATAKSPAMLVYLDNWLSAAPDTSAGTEPLRRGPGAQRPRRAPNMEASTQPQTQRRMRGLNENYARELLELHTLSVDGGYTQQDVVNVARAFTGWTIGRPNDPGFRFAAMMHDRGEKKILGHVIAAGGGIEDGEKVLDILATHPATARHIAFKLAQRFVSDAPPQGLVDRAAQKFQSTKGDLREVVRAIVTSPEFFAADAHRAKVKTPFEFVASALRATGADMRTAMPVVRALAGLGMPLYLCQPPTGYDETAATWVSSGALVNRMNFALAMSGGQLRGIRIADTTLKDAADARDRLIRDALGGDVSAATRDTVSKAKSVEQTIALVIGSPEFQRQ
jgi:uncharacterized protein (DUF1800 family)